MDSYFLVCGLGRLGQYCVLALQRFGCQIVAIEQNPLDRNTLEIDNLPDLLEDLVLGDCRRTSVLEQAQVNRCRAVLLTIPDEQVNVTTALAIRRLNPKTRLVIRSAQKDLWDDELLKRQLGNFVAFEPTELPADAFASGGLGNQTRASFLLGRELIEVIQETVKGGDNLQGISLEDFNNSRNRRILYHLPDVHKFPSSFYAWDGETRTESGDTLIYAKREQLSPSHWRSASLAQSSSSFWEKKKKGLENFFKRYFEQKFGKIVVFSLIVVALLVSLGTFFLHFYYKGGLPLQYAFYSALVLLLGGYGDVFGNPSPDPDIPGWLQGFSLLLTLAGTLFVAIPYALLTETLLASKFQLTKKRPPVPEENHIVVIGLGRVGQKVADLLQKKYKQTLVGVSFSPDLDRTILPTMPLVVGNMKESLEERVNLATAKSVVIVTDDDILNLEIALMSRRINPKSHLVVRAGGQALETALRDILPDADIVNPSMVAAEAFAGAAFGERINHVFQLNDQTILVTEYDIEEGDTLNGLLLSDIAYGYGVIPLLLQKRFKEEDFMPRYYNRLALGDRLVVLASSEGLSRIEQGISAITPKSWRIKVEQTLNPEAISEGANKIVLHTDCSGHQANELMRNLPQVLSTPLYEAQARDLKRDLQKIGVTAQLVPIERASL